MACFLLCTRIQPSVKGHPELFCLCKWGKLLLPLCHALPVQRRLHELTLIGSILLLMDGQRGQRFTIVQLTELFCEKDAAPAVTDAVVPLKAQLLRRKMPCKKRRFFH